MARGIPLTPHVKLSVRFTNSKFLSPKRTVFVCTNLKRAVGFKRLVKKLVLGAFD